MIMPEKHICHQEEQLIGQSRAIERLNAELKYKKERLDEIKEDNKRMEEKIDNLSKDITTFIQLSDKKDNELNTRLTTIETRLETQEQLTSDTRSDANLKIGALGVILVIVQLYFNFLR